MWDNGVWTGEDESVKEVLGLAQKEDIQVLSAWEELDVRALQGVLMVIGAPDSGKSTFARYLCRRLRAVHERVAFVDGDMGQARLGPPTTMTLAVGCGEDDLLDGSQSRTFVGSNSPRGHMLPTVVGLHRLVSRALAQGASAVVVDTTGLVSREQGGAALKRAKIELLRPTRVFGIQRSDELEHLLLPLRRSARTKVVELPLAPAVQPRDRSARRAYRAAAFRRYFAAAGSLRVEWARLAVFPRPAFSVDRLAALEDVDGFALALGVVEAIEGRGRAVVLRTPACSLQGVDGLRLGDLWLNLRTGEEK